MTDADDQPSNHDQPNAPDPNGVDGQNAAVEPSRARPWRLAVAVLAALAIGLAFVAAIQTSRVSGDRERDAEVRRTAAAMGTALLTYDYTRLDATTTDVLQLATSTFRREYKEALSGQTAELLKTTKATSEVKETEVFLSEIGDDEASALVVVTLTVSGTAGTNRRLVSYIRLDLVRTTGRWLVNAITNLNLGQPAAPAPTPPDTAPTTTTTP